MPDEPYPSLRVQVRIEGVQRDVVALVDTGFDGHLAVPSALVDQLPQPAYVRRVRTASGQVVHTPAYLGSVQLSEQPGQIEALIIALGDEYLLGLPTINHFKVTFDHGRTLTVEP